MDWLDGIAGQQYGAAMLWTAGALVLLLVILLIVKLARGMIGGTFVAGGRNRKTRLAVMDAAAVDSNRRLVLVRRDDVEHLILIGGPTDVVVERDIRLGAPRRPQPAHDERQPAPPPRPRPPEEPQHPPARPPERPRPPAAAPTPRPVQQQQQDRAPAPRPPTQPPAPRAAQQPRQQAPQAILAPPARPEPARAAPPPADELDDELLQELRVSFEPDDEPVRQLAPGKPEPAALSLDEEMTKLLGELSTTRR